MTTVERDEAERVVGQLQTAWNAMDGAAFAAPFAEDADFVNILGEHFRGRERVAAGHVGIFQTIYAGSTSILDVPQGLLAGRHVARFSMVLTRGPRGWEIAAFHNTRMDGERTMPR